MQYGHSLPRLRDIRFKPYLALCALFALALPFQVREGRAAGTTYYVSPAGSDSSSGAQAAPFRQIRRALQVAGAGDTILVADGDYLGFSLSGKSGTATAPLVVRAIGSNARLVPTTDRADNRDNMLLSGCAYVVLDGLRTFQAPRAGLRITGSHHITVKNGVFGDNQTWGIFTDFSDDVLVENNECYGSKTQHGIYFSNSGDRPVARGNRSHHNAGCGIHTNGDVSMGGDGIISGLLYENNVCWNNGALGGAALNLDGTHNGIVRNNLLFNNVAGGIACFQIDGAQGPTGMQILNNTVDMPSTGRWALLMTQTSGLNTVRNNILIHRGVRGGINFGSWGDVANTDSDYNLMDKVTPNDGGTFLSLSDWKGQGYEAHSLAPGTATASLFLNVAAGDYHLATGALALDKGTTLAGVTTDRDGVNRPQGAAYDLGCYERVVGGTDTTPPAVPTGLTAQAGDAQATVSWNANTESDLAGYNLYRSTSQSGSYARQNTTVLTARTLTQTGLTNGTTYWYRVSAVDRTGNESAQSTAVSAAPQAAAPTTFSIRGTVTADGSGLSGVTMTAGGQSTSNAASGNYVLSGLVAGTYTVSASKSGYTLSAPQTVTVGPDKTGVNFTATPVAAPAGFVKGINLNGPAVTIEGNPWLSYQQALSQGLSVANAIPWSGTYGFPLTPAPDADTRNMLQGVLYRAGAGNGVGFTLSQALPNGSYDVYVWTVENYVNNFRDLTLVAEGTTVATGLGNLNRGEWRKYGPYRVSVQDGKLDLDVLRTSKGDPLLAGIAIHSAGP